MSKNMSVDLYDYLKAEERQRAEYIGVEEEEKEEVIDDNLPYDIKDIRIEQKMITVFQVEHWIQSGVLNLAPEYQRNKVWDHKRKSALIESLMLRIPIPTFYLDEDEQGKKSVIDGMQRLSTIHEFINDGFKLIGLQYLSKYERMTFSQLELKFRANIEDAALEINILDARCPKMVKFDVFRRVNTGGVPLNPQEIRNIMATPRVRKLLRDMAGCEEFLLATGNRINDVRMSAQELCLRYLTILFCYDWEKDVLNEYYGLMKSMDNMVLTLNRISEKGYQDIVNTFKKVMKQCHCILGELSFYKPNFKLINKSLFTGWSVVLTNLCIDDETIEKHKDDIYKEYKISLNQNSEFFNAITSSTGTKKHVMISIHVIRNIVEKFV